MGWPAENRCIAQLTAREQLVEARRIIRHEADVLAQVADDLSDDFCEALGLIQSASGTVVLTGVGKAGLIAQKVVATLCSTGTRSRFLHPTEALHGDIGTVASDDVVLAFSNSGETEEVNRLLPVLQAMDVPVIALTRNHDSTLSRLSDVTIAFGQHSEACALGLAPSSSTTAMLAIGDAVALVLSRSKGFTAADFGRFHPAGSLGRKLTAVSEVMRQGSQLRIARDVESVREVMISHAGQGRRTGAVILVADSGQLTGLFTDSDLARMFENRLDDQLDQSIRNVMTVNPVTITRNMMLPAAIHLMSERKLSELPVIDELRRPIGMLDITDVLQYMDPSQQQMFMNEFRVISADAA